MQHVHHIPKMLELGPPGATRIVFIHRDGRDVAHSFKARGYGWAKAVSRWVDDNTAALPFLDAGAAMAVGFEQLAHRSSVLSTLRRVADFLSIPASNDQLVLALLPGTREHAYQEYCTAYRNDEDKQEDLRAGLVGSLAAQGAAAGTVASQETFREASAEDDHSGSAIRQHNALRTWQMTQAWTEVVAAPAARELSKEEEEYFWGRSDVAALMARFGYGRET